MAGTEACPTSASSSQAKHPRLAGPDKVAKAFSRSFNLKISPLAKSY
jgi:hypothetical protein